MIVSGGVIGSPQLLLLSGIGPADDLSALGIDVRTDLPGVGENLHDHALATVLYGSARDIPPGTAQNLEAHFFAASDPAMVAPDLQPLMPAVTSGNTNAPTLMIGERCADFLLS